ncbi:hypothetical protein HPP92_021797 [Vanilla planifolia]|uniref:Uncharacterized protein n=1 Tax=Vanilla planifolia TaxID=51239 RepID=A0A835PW57_VANPL|nr:hypothetical protein HPP92_022102 [Vanilla planifolia]KAG0458669.1 hypothetical protein HPP92_021797 [Vanilla planifolia]
MDSEHLSNRIEFKRTRGVKNKGKTLFRRLPPSYGHGRRAAPSAAERPPNLTGFVPASQTRARSPARARRANTNPRPMTSSRPM